MVMSRNDHPWIGRLVFLRWRNKGWTAVVGVRCYALPYEERADPLMCGVSGPHDVVFFSF